MVVRRRSPLAWLTIATVLLFLLNSFLSVHGSSRFAKHELGVTPDDSRPLSSSSGFRGARNGRHRGGGEVFGDEKRRVHTGPDPLHNR
ncbi:hypothetical protein MLD38_011744 [Melastoma candidum]|uniref:Uncharacterized protein n=1 Tax=Melastoma candidum TaxID=119954 RepID=A0ACB9R869_9MYRT|nr:hypothetical protein MLD38_011744 [Melastoma candidum]